MLIVRGSELGACTKATIAKLLGMKPIAHSEATERLFREGNLHEDDVIATLRAEDADITRQQEEVNLQVTPGAVVQGHLDGVIVDNFPHPRVLEVKSMGKSSFDAFKAKGWEAGGLIDRYRYQISAYMLATGLEALVIAKSRDSGELLRHGVELPFYTLDQIAERVAYIEDHVARGQLPDDCPHDWFCDFKYLCSRSSEEDGAEHSSDELSPPELRSVELYHQLGLEIVQLEMVRKVHRERVEALVADEPKREGGGYRVQLVTQQIKERVVPASTRQMLRVTKTDEKEAE